MILQIEVTEEELQHLKQIAQEKGFSNPEAYVKAISLPAPVQPTPKRRTKARDLLALPPREREIAVREALLRAKDREDELFEADGDLIED
jgi:hypothetical protein